MPAIPITVNMVGYHTIIDSVSQPNGQTDYNTANNVSGTVLFIENNTGITMPYTTSFEDHADTGYYETDIANNGDIWGIWQTGSTTLLGHSGTYAAGFPLINYAPGTVNTIILPEVKVTDPAHTTMSFWVSYSQQTTTSSDKLEVVYSTDCGTTWTSLWSLTGSTMVTLPASTNSYSYPTSPTQYKKWSTSLSGVTAGPVMLGFRATDGSGNFLFVDDVNIYTSTEVNTVAATAETIKIFPNPAQNEATISFNLTDNSDVDVRVVDGLGRVMNVLANGKMEAGMHSLTLNTSAFASGLYNVMIHTDGGTQTEHLTIVK